MDSILRTTLFYTVLLMALAIGAMWVQEHGLPSFTEAVSQRLVDAANQK